MGKQDVTKTNGVNAEGQGQQAADPAVAPETVPEKKKGFWSSLGTGLKVLVVGGVVVATTVVVKVFVDLVTGGKDEAEETTEAAPEVSDQAA